MASATSSTSAASTFTGVSSYSTDLQNAISRAVSIANLPIQMLTNRQTDLQSQGDELSTIDTKFATLQTAIQNVDQAMSGSSFQTIVSDTSVVSATVSTGAMEGNYSINVQDVGAYATSLSAANWVKGAGPYSLMINGVANAITTTDTTATGIATAINSQYGNQVRATVVNVGTSSSPDNRLSLQSAALGPLTLNIQDKNGSNLQTAQSNAALGSPAQYSVNGAAAVTSSSRSVTISTGLTVSLLTSKPATSVNITVTRSTSALSSALSSFTDAYNAVATELNTQRGQSTGALQGQSIVSQLQSQLSKIATYGASSGQVTSLADLGLDLGTNGQITYNQYKLMGADILNSTAVSSFLGSAAKGGFLKSANDVLNNLETTGTGLVKTAEASIQSQVTDLGNNISAKQNQIAQMQLNLQSRMAAMDAMIASLQQQSSYLTSMFQAQDTASRLTSG